MATNETQLQKVFNTKVNVEVTKEDFVAVAIADYEERLKKTRDGLEEEVEQLNKKVEAATKKREKLVQLVAHKEAIAKLKPLVEAAAALVGDKVSEDDISVRSDSYLPNDPESLKEADHYISFSAKCSFEKKVPKKKKSDFSFNIDANGRVAIPADVIEIITEIKLLNDTLDEKSEHLYKIRRALSDMPAYERQARAKVAKQVMKAVQDGQEIDLSELFKIPGFSGEKLLT